MRLRFIIIALALLIAPTAHAQGISQLNQWKTVNSAYLTPLNALYGLSIPGLATSTTGCLSVASNGWISASGSACGSGGGGSSFATSSADYWLTTKSTTDLTEGSNLYFTTEGVASYINGSSTVPHIGGSAYGDVFIWDGAKWITTATSTLGISGGGGSGTVTSVGLSAPTGFSVSGTPVTSSGTLALSFTSGYSLPLTATTTDLVTFRDTPSTRITAGTGIDWSANTLNVTLADFSTSDLAEGSNKYFTNALADARIAAGTTTIQGMFSGTSPISYGAGAFSCPTCLTSNQSITLSGDVSGSGTTAITTTIGALKVLGSMIANATIDLTTKVTGILPVANGGTASSTLSGILKGNGTSAVQTAVGNTDYQLPITLTTTGSSGAATFNGTTLNIPQYANTTYTAGSGLTLTSTAFSLDVGHANSWTALQTFGNASTTNISADNLFITNAGGIYGDGVHDLFIDTSASHYLRIIAAGTNAAALDTSALTTNRLFSFPDETGTFVLGSGTAFECPIWSSANTLGSFPCPTGTGTVTSVGLSDSNSTLTIGGSPVTSSGTLTATLNLAHANTWTALQTFGGASSTAFSVTSAWWVPQTSAVLVADSAGKVGEASTQTCTNQFMRAMSAAYAATCATVQSEDINLGDTFVWTGAHDFGSATDFEIPNGSAPTVNTTGEIALDTTNDQLKVYGAGAVTVHDQRRFLTFSYATTTTMTGTTTLPLGTAPTGLTFKSAQCYTDAGTMNVQYKYGTGPTLVSSLFNASTTIGTVTFSGNNTPAAGNALKVDIGTPASTPTSISCTMTATVTGT